MGISEEMKEDLREAFEIYDKEKEGKVDKDKLGVILRSLGQNPTEGACVTPGCRGQELGLLARAARGSKGRETTHCALTDCAHGVTQMS